MKSKGKKKLPAHIKSQTQPADLAETPQAEPQQTAATPAPARQISREPDSPSFSIKPGKSERNAVLLILSITLVVFLNSLGGEFVYDDSYQILKNP
ncbi:MAG: hypothetical protein JNK38_28905, partial [Acidobacteria bacterium]|nr:hypothetical protein [Acidobacteriota bacterium]